MLATRDGFTLAILANELVSLTVVPALGAKVLSLVDRRTGREWMWAPPGDPPLFASPFAGDFPSSTIRGADECIPTIGACGWRGRELPDHGEAWSLPWAFDEAAFAAGTLTTSLVLPLTPLRVTRRITLVEATATFAYQVDNLGDTAEEFLWAFHPLLSWREGDRGEFPPAPTTIRCAATFAPGLRTLTSWQPQPGVDLEALELPQPGYAKVFAGGLSSGRAAIQGGPGDRLALAWDPQELPWFGFWLTRGGWNGYHHPALEPTTSGSDRLDQAVADGLGHRSVPMGGTSRWSFALTLGR